MKEGVAAREAWPARLPETHREFLLHALETLPEDDRLLAVAAGGSFISGEMDAYSDVDLVLVVATDAWEAVLAERASLAARLGPLLASFTGEHVGEPRLLICLYGPPLLHVDLKFVTLSDFAARVEDPILLWARDTRASQQLETKRAVYPQPDPQWIEDRFWVWVHYTAGKIERGEGMEVLDALAALRRMVLGPLALAAVGAQPQGVRRIETLRPDLVEDLRGCVSDGAPASMRSALRQIVDLYGALRDAGPPVDRRTDAEVAVRAHLASLEVGDLDPEPAGEPCP